MLEKIIDNDTGNVYWQANNMDENGLLQQETFGNNTSTTRQYDDTSKDLNLIKTVNILNGNIIQNLSYTFNPNLIQFVPLWLLQRESVDISPNLKVTDLKLIVHSKALRNGSQQVLLVWTSNGMDLINCSKPDNCYIAIYLKNFSSLPGR